MKTLFRHLNLLILMMVLALLPLQTSFAVISSCSDISNMKHHETSFSKNKILKKVALDVSSKDCCSTKNCVSAHCISSATMIITSSNTANNRYISSSMMPIFNKVFLNYSSSSIYRPPIS